MNCWSDGRRLGLAARLNECIDRARCPYLARMDADGIAYPDRLAQQLAFLVDHQEVGLCGGGAMIFGKRGRLLWRFSPPTDHGEIIGSPSLGFPLLHPALMGRIEWFRRWRYDENTRLAEDQELLQRSYRMSRVANLSQIVLGYREKRVTLGGFSKLLRLEYVCTQLGPGAWRKLRLSAGRRTAHGSSGSPGNFHNRACEVRNLWTLLTVWYGRPCSETFQPASLLQQPKSRHWSA